MIDVLVADDQALVRAGLRVLVDSAQDLRVVAEASGGEEAVALAAAHRPRVVLMDVRMEGLDGIEATRRICATEGLEGTRVVMLTTFDLDEYVHAALRAGASGFLLKDTPPADLLDGIRVVAGGEALLAPKVTRRLIEQFVRTPDRARADAASLGDLTARELDVLGLVAQGLSNGEIAEHLVLSHATVKTHVSRILQKTALRDRAQLVVLAYEAGLVVRRERYGEDTS